MKFMNDFNLGIQIYNSYVYIQYFLIWRYVILYFGNSAAPNSLNCVILSHSIMNLVLHGSSFTQPSMSAIFLFILLWLWKVRKMILCLRQFGKTLHFEMISIKFWKKKSKLSQLKLKNMFQKSNCLHLDMIEYILKFLSPFFKVFNPV